MREARGKGEDIPGSVRSPTARDWPLLQLSHILWDIVQIRGFGPAAHGLEAHSSPTDLLEKGRRLR